ncbi:MAG: type II secretion system F family protein [Chlamydiae bacterium]|nr:type II secretion system F family protein [Chlamydiota bacterium]
MPMYSYKALTEQGKKISGVIDADSLYLAKDRLKKRQLFITELLLQDVPQKQVVLPPSLLLTFTRELAQLLKAGLPLYESLVTIEEKYRGNKCHSLVVDLCDHLKLGKSLSRALSSYDKSFDEIYLSMIKAAEQSGNLAETFSDLAILISKQQMLKKQLFSALAYPAFLGVFCLLVIGGLFFFIIPSMQELFEGRQLHPLTSCVIGISKFLNESIHFLIVFFSSMIGLTWIILRQKKVQLSFLKIACKLPFISELLIQSALVRFSRAMYLLLSGGVPLLQSLSYSRKTMKNAMLENIISYAEKRLIEGKKLSELISSPFVPSLMIRMVAIAEETGNMHITMKHLAEIYEEELDKNLQQLTSFLQPAVLMFLGIVVGVVVLSILIPLTDVSSFLSS